MSNPQAALAELADRVKEAAAGGSVPSERAVQLRAVEPLIEVLGWDVRDSEVVPAATIDSVEVDYLLTVDDVPGVLVATAGPTKDLEADELAAIERGIAEGHAPRGIGTDGSTVVLLVEHDGDVHRRSFPFHELPNNAEALGKFHRSRVARTTAVDRADRRAAARRLAEHRAEVLESITDTVVDVADEPVEDEVAAEAARAVDALVETFRGEAADGADRDRSDASGPDDSEPGVDGPGSERPSAGSVPTARASSDGSVPTGDAGGTLPDDAGDDPAPSNGAEGEYVVRFFGGSSSVGAVGTESPSGTTVGTVRYLLENYGLASSVALPWRDGAGTVVLAEEPADDGWTTLSNGAGDSISVRPVDDPETARRVIDGLVEAAGLRAMFQGDW